MPLCQIHLNVPLAKVPNDLSKQVAEVLARCLSKPIEYVVVQVIPDQHIFSGSAGNATTPNGIATLRSIGAVGLKENRKTIAEVTKLMQDKLGIAPAEFRMAFIDHKHDTIGLGGKVFTDLL